MRASIGPIWDGNEVWLVAGAGAVFAAFPMVYAMTFSGFYLAIMLVLFGLILRAVSLEFRHRDPGWSRVWDGAFFLGSLVPAVLVGCALGNVIRGVPMDADGNYTGHVPGASQPVLPAGRRDRPVPHRHPRRGLGRAQVGGRAARRAPCGTALSPSGCSRCWRWRRPWRPSPRSRALQTTCSAGRSAGSSLCVLALSLLYTILQMLEGRRRAAGPSSARQSRSSPWPGSPRSATSPRSCRRAARRPTPASRSPTPPPGTLRSR